MAQEGEYAYLTPDPDFDYTLPYCDLERGKLEEALADARLIFGVTNPEELHHKVLRPAKKKILGIGKEWNMIVRCWVDRRGPAASTAAAVAKTPTAPSRAPRTPLTPEIARQTADRAQAYMQSIVDAMGESAQVTASVDESEGAPVGATVSLDGQKLGILIGRRGDTLEALQYLTGLAANNGRNDGYCHVTLDIENYREKREQSLSGLAHKLASQVLRTGRRTTLEPMSSYERRIIHTVVQDIAGVDSWSIGTGDARRVVIGLSSEGAADRADGATAAGGNSKGKSRGGKNRRGHGGSQGAGASHSASHGSSPRGDRPPRSGSGSGFAARDRRESFSPKRVDDNGPLPSQPREVRQFVSRSSPLPVAEDAQPPERTQSEREQSASLYGRIDL